jgi:pimeloyl-ACP methyl ester carboxylesterase
VLLVEAAEQGSTSDVGDYVELNGIRTWFDEEGAGPPLVLLHGGFVTNESWATQVPALATHYDAAA